MTLVGEPQVVNITPILYLPTTESGLVKSIDHYVMLLLQFLTDIHQISSEFWTVPRHIGHLMQ